MIRLDETRYWGIENPEDVRAGDIVFAISGNQYRAACPPPEHSGPLESIDCRNPDANPAARSGYSFDLPYANFDYALRHKPTGAPDQLDQWRPDGHRVCLNCHASDSFVNDGVLPRTRSGAVMWDIRWKCPTCGHISRSLERDKDKERRLP